LKELSENLRFVERGMSLVEVGRLCGKNELSTCNTALNSMHPGHAQFFLKGGLLGTTLPIDTWGLL
jgi:hypothetical protein